MVSKTVHSQGMSLETFVAAAKAYCHLVETYEQYEVTAFLAQVHPSLAALYHAALLLPEVEPEDVSLERPIPSERAFRLLDELSIYLGVPDRYRLVMEPYELEEEAAKAIYAGSLADDLVDTYREVKNGLLLWEGADASVRQRIVWDWRYGFAIHWARHASSALYVLSFHLNDDEDLEDLE